MTVVVVVVETLANGSAWALHACTFADKWLGTSADTAAIDDERHLRADLIGDGENDEQVGCNWPKALAVVVESAVADSGCCDRRNDDKRPWCSSSSLVLAVETEIAVGLWMAKREWKAMANSEYSCD